MKKWILLTVCLLPALSQAATYAVNSYRITGGGGSGCNWQYCESGVIIPGSLPSGPLTGGRYSVRLKRWSSVSAVNSPGLPTLSITRVGGSIVVSWPNTGNYTLQQNSNLAVPGGWTTSGYTVSASNSINSITFTPAGMGNLFFRLSSANP